jgi:ADP-ribose pyrophosphatase
MGEAYRAMSKKHVDGPPPVVLRARRIIHANEVWTVYADRIRAGDGAEIDGYVVLEPRVLRADGVSGVAMLPLVDGRIVLRRAYRHPIGRYTWELPRGFLDQGEEPAAAALRELEEETGLTCDAADVRPLGYMLPESSTIAGKEALFVALRCRPAAGAMDKSEPAEVASFAEAEVRAMLARLEIEDSSALAALYRYLELRRRDPGA